MSIASIKMEKKNWSSVSRARASKVLCDFSLVMASPISGYAMLVELFFIVFAERDHFKKMVTGIDELKKIIFLNISGSEIGCSVTSILISAGYSDFFRNVCRIRWTDGRMCKQTTKWSFKGSILPTDIRNSKKHKIVWVLC